MLSSWTACHCRSTTAAPRSHRSTRSGLALPGSWMVQVSRTADQQHVMRRETVTETTYDTADSPPKRRRVDWLWECPACSNKHPSGPRLLLHMHKCCGDLLPSTYDKPYLQGLLAQEQSQQHPQQNHRQQPDGQQPSLQVEQLRADSADSTNHFQQVLAAAGEQEHTLRMQALRLRFIGEATQHAQAAAEAEDVEDDGLVDSSPTPAGSHPTAVREPGAQEHPTGHAASTAAATGGPAAATAPAPGCGDSSGQKPPPVAKRRRKLRSSARVPVRSIEQVMQAMQLPHARVLKLLERAPRSIRLVSDKETVQVVYEDDAFLAICKPPGLRSAPVHRFMGGSAVNRMIGHLGAEPHLLHRLDMDTSGVLVAAKDAATANAINSQFQAKQVSKAYLALCLGVPEQQQFIVDGPIGQHPDVTVARKVVPGGQPAVTHVQVLSVSTACPQAAAATLNGSSSSSTGGVPVWGPAAAADAVSGVRGAGCCLVCCRPVTGRTHQIRVHMAHSGHPLLGDDVYGLQGPWIGRQALHAVSLTLTHPGTGQPVTFQAAPPEDFVAAAAALGLDVPQLDELCKVPSGH